MKPFNLQRAIAGDPIMTRDGRKVKLIAHLPEMWHDFNVVCLIEDDRIETYTRGGQYDPREKDYCLDIFMVPKKHTVWVNFYDDGTAVWNISKENADHHDEFYVDSCMERIGGKAYPVEIDE